jgi:hypothetical protein
MRRSNVVTRDWANAFRHDGGAKGHYESYFLRGNHPTRPEAFWIRYTMFTPKGDPTTARGELWAVYFDGEAGRVTAVKENHPLAESSFSKATLSVRIGTATLDGARLEGAAHTTRNRIGWQLTYESSEPPLLLLPETMYRAPLPKAKALVSAPHARFAGHLEVDGQRIAVDGWPGSQNHNWGEKHTDRYAWGQVAGFDDAPGSFLECATASIKLGPVHTPPMSPIVLRHEGHEYALRALPTSLRARASYGYFHWELASRDKACALTARFTARREDFVALRYDNPPGGAKTCLNTKIARCELSLERPGKPAITLHSASRAAFEILTDDASHGVARLEA